MLCFATKPSSFRNCAWELTFYDEEINRPLLFVHKVIHQSPRKIASRAYGWQMSRSVSWRATLSHLIYQQPILSFAMTAVSSTSFSSKLALSDNVNNLWTFGNVQPFNDSTICKIIWFPKKFMRIVLNYTYLELAAPMRVLMKTSVDAHAKERAAERARIESSRGLAIYLAIFQHPASFRRMLVVERARPGSAAGHGHEPEGGVRKRGRKGRGHQSRD